MKTPREILLSSHKKAEPRLNAVRKSALRAVAKQNSEASSQKAGAIGSLLRFLQELFFPAWPIWSALAACWAVILILHLAAHDTSTVVAQKSPPPSPAMIAELRDQQQLFVELISGETKTSDADKPHRARSLPHSELRSPSAVA